MWTRKPVNEDLRGQDWIKATTRRTRKIKRSTRSSALRSLGAGLCVDLARHRPEGDQPGREGDQDGGRQHLPLPFLSLLPLFKYLWTLRGWRHSGHLLRHASSFGPNIFKWAETAGSWAGSSLFEQKLCSSILGGLSSPSRNVLPLRETLLLGDFPNRYVLDHNGFSNFQFDWRFDWWPPC